MNVKELIGALAEVPEDAPVFVKGYEGGVDYLTHLMRVGVKLDQNSEWYYGAHETVDPEDSYEAGRYGQPDVSGILFT